VQAHCPFFNHPGIPDQSSGHGLCPKDVQGAIIEYCEAFDNGSVGGPRNGGGPVFALGTFDLTTYYAWPGSPDDVHVDCAAIEVRDP